MKYNKLFVLTICLATGLLSHIMVLAENNGLYMKDAPIEDDSKIICDVVYTAIAGTQGFNSFEDYSSLVDGNDDSKWCTSSSFSNFHGGLPYYIIFRASKKISPTWYRLVTGNDTGFNPGRNWKKWKIYGGNFSDDNAAITSYNITSPVNNYSRWSSAWTMIDDKNGYPLPASNTTEVDIYMSNPSDEDFQYFLVEIYESVGESIVQMAEMSFGSQANTSISGKNFLSVPPRINIEHGGRIDFPILMTNEDDICSLQFDLILPTGFVVATDEDGKAITELSERTNEKLHSISFRKLDSGAYRFIILSATNTTFSNNSGEVLTISIVSSPDLPVGEYVVNMNNIVLTNPSARRFVAENVTGILNITEDVTITVQSYTREYGEDNPTFEYTVSGGTITSGTPTITCSATKTSPVGTYDILIEKGTVSNKAVELVKGTLTITKASLTISAGNYTKKQYDPMPEFAVQYEGFKNNETENVLTKQPTLSCEANEDSTPGEYPIAISGAEATNYQIQYVGGKMTITEPDSYTLTYIVDGEEYQKFSVKYRESIAPLDEPFKEGYTFSGWSEIPATMPAKDVVVTGSFTINSYTLTYMVDGKEYKTSSVVYGTTITPEAEPSKEGYTFSGWSEIPATMPAKDVVVTGSFTLNSYKLTYEVDGKVYKTSIVAYGTDITPEAEPTKEGYSFSGWSEIPKTMPAKDVTVYGKFTVNSYTVTFMYGDEVLYTEEVKYGKVIPIPEIFDKYGLVYKWLDVPETMPAHDVVILVDETDMIDGPTPDPSLVERGTIYNMNGRRLSAPQKGYNIIRMSDGTSRKVMVK